MVSQAGARAGSRPSDHERAARGSARAFARRAHSGALWLANFLLPLWNSRRALVARVVPVVSRHPFTNGQGVPGRAPGNRRSSRSDASLSSLAYCLAQREPLEPHAHGLRLLLRRVFLFILVPNVSRQGSRLQRKTVAIIYIPLPPSRSWECCRRLCE